MKPKGEVGCNFLANGADCSKGDKCEFSHDPAIVAERKKFLAKFNKDNAQPKKKKKAGEAAAASTRGGDDDEEEDCAAVAQVCGCGEECEEDESSDDASGSSVD